MQIDVLKEVAVVEVSTNRGWNGIAINSYVRVEVDFYLFDSGKDCQHADNCCYTYINVIVTVVPATRNATSSDVLRVILCGWLL